MPRLPYGRQWIGTEEIRKVSEVLSSDWLTQGPLVETFEKQFAAKTGASEAVAFANGTLALFGMCHAAGLKSGDEVITSPLTFVATANAVLSTGAVPVFADVDPETGNLDPEKVEKKLSPKTRALLAVDYAGHPASYDALSKIAEDRRLLLLADAAHSLGATYGGRPAGALARMSAFSFHPVKHITTGEGGMVSVRDAALARTLREYRNHGIVRDRDRMTRDDGPWYYEVRSMGINARLTDLQSALGIEQLSRLDSFVSRRREVAARYSEAFRELEGLRLPVEQAGVNHSYHLYVVRVDPERSPVDRKGLYDALQKRGLGVQVHYVPVPEHPLYRERFGDQRAALPEAYRFYETCLSLPMYPRMTEEDVAYAVTQVRSALRAASA